MVIPDIQTITQCPVTTFQCYGMTLLYGSTQRLIQPISIHASLYLSQFILIILQDINTAVPLVHSGQHLRSQFFLRVHQVIIWQIRNLNAKVSPISYPQPAFFRHFRLNDNHPVCSTRTIDCRGCSILQQGNWFHPIRIHINHRLQINFKTIHDQQRFIGISIVFPLQCHHLGRSPGITAPGQGGLSPHT